MERFFDTQAAAQRLAELGVRRSPATLRKLRCTGGGPIFRRLGAKPVYTEPDLIVWIKEQLSGPLGSTSEADPA
jgi:hypothetical protein